MRKRARNGEINIFQRIVNAFEGIGFRVEYVNSTEAERAKSVARRGYSLFYMDHPFHKRALTLRKAYFFPYWRIERSAKRWEWDISKSEFDAGTVDPDDAKNFSDYWRGYLFKDRVQRDPNGMVYIPLQGRLTEHRSFQTQSPMDMVRTVLLHDRRRDIVLGLHPGETYLPEEIEALRNLVDKEPRLTLSSEPATTLLQRCDYTVTQNSSVALMGFFIHKPTVLFAKIDFHHIAANVEHLGARAAIAAAPRMRPDFDAYMHWFLKQTAIHARQPNTESRILNEVRKRGWEI